MGEFADRMGSKNPGDLILSEDWNSVIEEIDTINDGVAAVNVTAQENHNDIEGLSVRIGAAETQLTELLAAINILRNRFRRVTLNTTKSRFALGEAGVITATLSAVDGSALDLSNAATRPWIDFATVWGRLKTANGFTGVGGEGSRTVSVQVNAQGIARVELRAETSYAVTEEEEKSTEAVMQTQTGSGIMAADIVLAATSPQDAQVKEVYQIARQVYDDSHSRQFSSFADKYYLERRLDPAFEAGFALPNWISHDYRTSVMAFVKGDNNPLTAEPSLGSAAIQVTFRDWIGPWIVLDYLPSYIGFVAGYRNVLAAAIGNNYAESNDRVMAQIGDIITGKGRIAQQRDLKALDAAADGLLIENAPAFLPAMSKQLQDTLVFQQAFNQLPQSNTMQTMMLLNRMDVKSRGETENLRQELKGLVASQMSDARREIISEVRTSQQELKDELFAESNPDSISGLQRKVASIDGALAGLRQLDAGVIGREIVKIEGLNQRLMMLENPR